MKGSSQGDDSTSESKPLEASKKKTKRGESPKVKPNVSTNLIANKLTNPVLGYNQPMGIGSSSLY
jgi:hypothetical protein